MSILRYFKRVNKTGAKVANDDGLPESNSSLSKSVPPTAIKLANANVSWQLKAKNEGCSRGLWSKPYLMLTPGQRYEIGKRAAGRARCGYYPLHASLVTTLRNTGILSETSMRKFKDLYKDHRQQQAKPRPASEDSNNASNNSDPSTGTSEEVHVEEIKELPRKKPGRPLLLPDALDH